jgi:hypothetical protein
MSTLFLLEVFNIRLFNYLPKRERERERERDLLQIPNSDDKLFEE